MGKSTAHAFEILANPEPSFAPLVVLFGEDRFLHQESLRHLIAAWIGQPQSEFSVSRLDGESALWPDVADSLQTGSLFSSSGRRIVVVDNGGAFVKEHRAALEALVTESHATNCLVLIVDSWPANTRLYKLVEKSGMQIDCGPPSVTRGKSKQIDEAKVSDWLIARARSHYSFELSKSAAKQLIELSPCSFALFDQQLAKLSCYGESGKSLTAEKVAEWIGGWKISNVWQLIDAAVDGDLNKAWTLLHRLLHAGEHPLALFGQISWSLRRYGEALEIYDRGQRESRRPRLQECLEPAGFRPWGGELNAAEARLKRLGPRRARRILRWLLKTDLALKGTHSTDVRGRFALERLITLLAKPAETTTAAGLK
jgi:DNA polymerase-3 subunit delta